MREFSSYEEVDTEYNPIHNYLYMNGIIVPEIIRQPNGSISRPTIICDPCTISYGCSVNRSIR
jgi:hypothetical protein